MSTSWQVDVPLPAATGTYHLVGRASYQQRPGEGQPLQQAGGFSRTTLDPGAQPQSPIASSSISARASPKTPS